MPSLEFTMMVGCPLMCTFCPQDKLRGAYGREAKYFTVADFRTIVAKLPPHVRIDFSGMAEPWANPDATEMLRHALEEGRGVAIYTTLYGMSRDDCGVVLGLLESHAAQVEVICLHLPDRAGNMRGWKHSAEYEANLADFLRLAQRRILPRFEVMTMDREGFVHPALARLGIRCGSWLGHTRAGNIEVAGQSQEEAPQHAGAVSCGFTHAYDQNVVLPNGDVVLCCMDYGLQHRIGNLLRQDYYDLFAGPEIGALRAENMQQRFSDQSLCRTCNRAVAHQCAAGRLMWRPA